MVIQHLGLATGRGSNLAQEGSGPATRGGSPG